MLYFLKELFIYVGHLIKNTFIRRVLKALMWILIVLLLIPALLYVPFVQDFVKDIALKEVSKSTGMTIEVDRFRLKWPLRLRLEGVTVVEAQGDTMLRAGDVALNVGMMQLLRLDIHADAELNDVRYQLGTPDSVMYLVADVKNFRLKPSNYDLKHQRINISKARLDGGDVTLLFNGTDTTATPVDTTASMPLVINAGLIELHDINYRMAMLPTIDSLGVNVPLARLRDGLVDMGKKRIHASSLSVDSISAAYLTPSLEWLKTHPVDSALVARTDTVVTPSDEMWVITGDSVSLTAKEGLYAMRGAVPQPGLDMSYLQVRDVDIRVDSFYNKGVCIDVPLRWLAAKERCGVTLGASGRFSMDSVAMRAERFDITTLFSQFNFSAMMGMGDFASDPSLPLELKAIARVGLPDLEMIMPSMEPMLKNVPRYNDMKLEADINGTVSDLSVDLLSAALPGYMNVEMRGNVVEMMNPDRLGGRIDIEGRLNNVNFIKPTVLEAKLAKEINIPPIRLAGRVDMNRGAIKGNLDAYTGGGAVLLDAAWNGRVESYDVDVAMQEFPVASIMPGLGVGNVSATAAVKGRGYNPMSPRTSIDAKIDVTAVEYQKIVYSDIRAWAELDSGKVDAGVMSMNHDANFDLTLTGAISADSYEAQFEGDVRNLDLMGLKMSPTMSKGSFAISGNGRMVPKQNIIDADVKVTDLMWDMPDMSLSTPQIDASLASNDSTMTVKLQNESLNTILVAGCPLDSFTTRLTSTMALLDRNIAAKRIDIDSIQKSLPPFVLELQSGRKSILSGLLEPSKASFNSLSLNMRNDSLMRMNGDAYGIAFGDTRIDTVKINAFQHGKYLVFRASMNNRPGTFDDFAHVTASGFIANENLSVFVNQSNIQNETGFKLGVNLAAADSVITLRMTPLKPVIGYKTWSINPDNIISVNLLKKHIDANLNLTNGDSHLKIYTEHGGGEPEGQEDIIVNASGIQLADWLSLSPFAPPVKGVAGADIRLGWNAEEKSITGNGNVSLDDLFYGGERVGSFLFDVGLTTDASGVVNASTSLMVDSMKVITAVGKLNDSTAVNPFMLDFSMIHFPLRIVNPFLPPGMASLSGMLNGEMDVTGTLASPTFNGYLDFDSAAVMVDMIGTAFSFSENKIPVDSNVVTFDNYTISAKNENPLYINGLVDMKNLMSPMIDLSMKARNMMIIDSKKKKSVDVYGKAYIDLDGSVKGNLDFMRVNARLDLLEGSNVTYVVNTVTDGLSTLGTTDDDMVRFVQFADTAAVTLADTIANSGMAMMLDAQLIVSQGTTINVDISANGQDKAQIQGTANLNFSMSPFSDMRLTGRFNIDNGFVRYTPPLMSQKLFNFESGSYVAFNGDMMNPILNLHAHDTMKANVTESGQDSRLVNFIVALNVTGTLNNMDVGFDLSTNDDLTVQNELETMSPEQRANQAMNLLLYNVYTGPGTKASANLGGNPLFSFLTSRLNSWAANTIKGVDISFGIDQYDRTADGATSTTTSYSYRVSKSLFNDRFKIVVGGNYSTDANMDENFSQNLINDISFEYMLNRSGSMYVRLFRHVGYESILEGEVIQTGVGFVYRRKLASLRDMFRFRRRQPFDDEVAVPAVNNTSNDEKKDEGKTE